MFSKVLVANRGEIAVRAFRAAREIGARTVAVFPHEDRGSEHRMKAEEAYQIGEEGHPVRAYLDPEAIVEVAVRHRGDRFEAAEAQNPLVAGAQLPVRHDHQDPLAIHQIGNLTPVGPACQAPPAQPSYRIVRLSVTDRTPSVSRASWTAR